MSPFIDITTECINLSHSLPFGDIIQSPDFSFRIANTAEIIGHPTLDSGLNLFIHTPQSVWDNVVFDQESLPKLYQLSFSLFSSWLSGNSPSSTLCRFSGFWLQPTLPSSPLSNYLNSLLASFLQIKSLLRSPDFPFDDDDFIIRTPADFSQHISSLTSSLDSSFSSDSIVEKCCSILAQEFHNLVCCTSLDSLTQILNTISSTITLIESNSHQFSLYDVPLSFNNDTTLLESLGAAKYISTSKLPPDVFVDEFSSFKDSLLIIKQIVSELSLFLENDFTPGGCLYVSLFNICTFSRFSFISRLILHNLFRNCLSLDISMNVLLNCFLGSPMLLQNCQYISTHFSSLWTSLAKVSTQSHVNCLFE
ncbi:hypothetical protein GEMRC1_002498 [Eukaryota sp. GEM-RC1]